MVEAVVLTHKFSKHAQQPASTPLYGPSGTRQSRKGISAKMQWLDRIAGQDGSFNCIMSALSGNCKAFAALARNARVSLYHRQSVQQFALSNLVSFGWDAATYYGHSVNLCAAWVQSANVAVCLKPMVSRDLHVPLFSC